MNMTIITDHVHIVMRYDMMCRLQTGNPVNIIHLLSFLPSKITLYFFYKASQSERIVSFSTLSLKRIIVLPSNPVSMSGCSNVVIFDNSRKISLIFFSWTSWVLFLLKVQNVGIHDFFIFHNLNDL